MSELNYIKVTRRDVEQLTRGTFPDYRGRKFKIVVTEKVSIHDLNWSGGSRSQYRACSLEGRPLGGLDRFNAMWPGDNYAEGKSVPIAPGACVVRHSIFCGKDTGLTVYVHPSDARAFLPAPVTA